MRLWHVVRSSCGRVPAASPRLVCGHGYCYVAAQAYPYLPRGYVSDCTGDQQGVDAAVNGRPLLLAALECHPQIRRSVILAGAYCDAQFPGQIVRVLLANSEPPDYRAQRECRRTCTSGVPQCLYGRVAGRVDGPLVWCRVAGSHGLQIDVCHLAVFCKPPCAVRQRASEVVPSPEVQPS